VSHFGLLSGNNKPFSGEQSHTSQQGYHLGNHTSRNPVEKSQNEIVQKID